MFAGFFRLTWNLLNLKSGYNQIGWREGTWQCPSGIQLQIQFYFWSKHQTI